MEKTQIPSAHESGNDMDPGTLGQLLFADRAKSRVSEQQWVALVRSIAAGNQRSLHELYDRTHRLVFTLAVRITNDRATAEEVTLDVLYDVWRRASMYDVSDGTVLGWIMNQARSRAIDRLRFEQRKKRDSSQADASLASSVVPGPEETVGSLNLGQVLRNALTALTPDERLAIECAFFSEMTYAKVAAWLNEPLGTIKTRIRSGLGKLRDALPAAGDS